MSTSIVDDDASISIPSIAFVAVLGFLIYRYFFSSPSGSSTGSSSRAGGVVGQRFTQQQVDHVAQMFPQLNRRDIMWDLHRNRGNVAATTERVLMGGGRLESAPLSFQPVLPPTATQLSSTTTATSSVASTGYLPASLASKVNAEPDLITRYNLQARVGSSDKGKGKEEDPEQQQQQQQQANHGWAGSKDERQAMLKRRRDEMILAARRKMMERDAQGPAGTTRRVDSTDG